MKKDILAGLAFAACTLLLSLAAKFAHARGYIDGTTVLRVVALNGLFVAYLGNALPKAVVPYAWAQKVRRFGGWSLFLSGLAFTGLWIFAPIPVAVVFGTGAIFAGAILTLVYCAQVNGQARAAARG